MPLRNRLERRLARAASATPTRSSGKKKQNVLETSEQNARTPSPRIFRSDSNSRFPPYLQDTSLRTPTLGMIQEQGFLDFLYRPHTMSMLAVLFAVLCYVGFNSRARDPVANAKTGLAASLCLFICYCAVQMRDSILVRPHPVVWRVVHGFAVSYLVLLVFLFMQSLDDVRSLLSHVDPQLGKSLAFRKYGADCRIYTPNGTVMLNGEAVPSSFAELRKTAFTDSGALDVFVLAHAIGWAAKALVYRDTLTLWVLSFTFEILEVTFQNILPNFNECWWDHMGFDTFGCNALGIVVGMTAVDFLWNRNYNWTGMDAIKSKKGRAKRILLQFSPFSFQLYQWRILKDPRRFLKWLVVCVGVMVCDLNTFFIKHILWIPTSHYLNVIRLVIIALVGAPAFAEWYQYVVHSKESDTYPRVGLNAWVVAAIIVTEMLMCAKWSQDDDSIVWDFVPWAKWTWAASTAILVLWFYLNFFVWQQSQDCDTTSESRRQSPKTKTLREHIVYGRRELPWYSFCLFLSIPVPLLALLARDCFRTMYYHPPPPPGQDGW